MGGRGRGRGSGTSFSREQLNTIGGAEIAPGPVTQPPPLYPLLERKPVPLPSSIEIDYLLVLKRDFLDHMQFSGAYLQMPQPKNKVPDDEIDKLLAQLPSLKDKFDWNLFPSELRPKVLANRTNVVKKSKEIDVVNRLNRLEAMEQVVTKKETEVTIKTEEVEDEEEEELIEDEVDEEMDDGTDYVNNYFDNGEAFEDEDDNLDDGPIY